MAPEGRRILSSLRDFFLSTHFPTTEVVGYSLPPLRGSRIKEKQRGGWDLPSRLFILAFDAFRTVRPYLIACSSFAVQAPPRSSVAARILFPSSRLTGL